MTKKRFIKLLMGIGIPRNQAEDTADIYKLSDSELDQMIDLLCGGTKTK